MNRMILCRRLLERAPSYYRVSQHPFNLYYSGNLSQSFQETTIGRCMHGIYGLLIFLLHSLCIVNSGVAGIAQLGDQGGGQVE